LIESTRAHYQSGLSTVPSDGRVRRGPCPPVRRTRREVDIGDGGRFNDHLDRLVGTFVKETSDGYGLIRIVVTMYRR